MTTIFTELVRSAAKRFDDRAYPVDVYYHLLAEARAASTPADLGRALEQALAWKDGKIRLNPEGQYVAQPSGVHYGIEKTKPGTLSDKHRPVLSSQAFFEWAISVRRAEAFDLKILIQIQRQFDLWSSIVIPVFVLHCLNPRVFPIIDRWVLAAQNAFTPDSEKKPTVPTLDSYERYQKWWLRVLGEAGLGPFSADLSQLKEIDAGLWALGKALGAESAKKQPKVGAKGAGEAGSTDSHAFKMRAIAIWKSGTSQRNAMVKAAEEMGIDLKPSYLAYPGSHFDRWRKQNLL